MNDEADRQKKMADEFQALCKPLNEWLQKNHSPNTKIIIENSHAEIVTDIVCVPFDVIA